MDLPALAREAGAGTAKLRHGPEVIRGSVVSMARRYGKPGRRCEPGIHSWASP